MFFAGLLVGSVLSGVLSDRYLFILFLFFLTIYLVCYDSELTHICFFRPLNETASRIDTTSYRRLPVYTVPKYYFFSFFQIYRIFFIPEYMRKGHAASPKSPSECSHKRLNAGVFEHINFKRLLLKFETEKRMKSRQLRIRILKHF